MKNSPKILIISPAKVNDPLGLMYLSAELKKAGFSTQGVLIEQENILKTFKKYEPDIVLYSMSTGEHKICLSLNKKLKKKGNFIAVFGGPHVTFFPDIIKEDGVDAIGIGECDKAIVDFVKKIAENQSAIRVKNFWIKKNNRIYRNDLRSFDDLDNIAFPDRDLFAKYKREDEHNVITTRGCPYDCTYCFNAEFKKLYSGKGRFVRFRSIDNIIEEIKELKKRGAKIINFHDDLFIMNGKRLEEFSKKYRQQINLPFICSVRANLVTEEAVKLLKKANCQKIFMGVEAGNHDVAVNLLKRKITEKQLFDAVNLFKKYNISVFTQNILGLPQTTIVNDFETLELNIRLKPDFAWVSIFTPYPKTALGDLCIKKGLIKNFDDIYETYHYKSALKIPHKNQIHTLHKLFSLAVDYSSLLPKIKEIASQPRKYAFDDLHNLFVLYRRYKYEKVVNPKAKIPKQVERFIKKI